MSLIFTVPAVGQEPTPPPASDAGVHTAALTAEDAPVQEAGVVGVSETDTEEFSTVGVTWDADTGATDVSVQLRVETDGQWSEWQDVESDTSPEDVKAADEAAAETGRDVRLGTPPVYVGEGATGVEVKLDAGSDTVIDPEVSLINPDRALPAADQPTPRARVSSSLPKARVPVPAVVSRESWGAGQACSSTMSAYKMNSIKGFVIHHTAGSNNYTRAQSPGIVRGIFTYHTRSQGWCDIGYNFLVDKYGTIYEGRSGSLQGPIRGSHAGSWNRDTLGISMMGTHTSTAPSAATTRSVSNVVAWWADMYGINP